MGRPKQLLTVGRETLLLRVLGQCLASGLDPVVLVLGFQAERVVASLGRLADHPKLRIVRNPRFREGMSTSLILGLEAVESTRDRVMILLADMPHITSEIIDGFREHALESERPLAAVTVAGRRSLPVVIGRALYGEVKELTGDVGARGLFHHHPEELCLWEPPGGYDDSDIDTPEAYHLLQKRLGKGTPP
jgi:molybdenum cofactor cytidylyltransferase